MTSPRSTREATRREAGSARKGESGISAINCQDHPMTNNPTDDELRAAKWTWPDEMLSEIRRSSDEELRSLRKVVERRRATTLTKESRA